MQNNEENKQADENIGSDREKKGNLVYGGLKLLTKQDLRQKRVEKILTRWRLFFEVFKIFLIMFRVVNFIYFDGCNKQHFHYG